MTRWYKEDMKNNPVGAYRVWDKDSDLWVRKAGKVTWDPQNKTKSPPLYWPELLVRYGPLDEVPR